MTTFKPVQNHTLPEVIAEQIMGQIRSGILKPGDRLPTESELMSQFRVGRSTLREALKSLTVAGLIESRRGAGTFVSESYTGFLADRLSWTMVFTEADLRHIVEVRRGLEGQTAALAALRATPAQIQRLGRLVELLEADGHDAEQATITDMNFHVLIAEASQNPLLLNLILSIRDLVRNYIKLGYTDTRRPDPTVGDHRRILDAITARDPDSARQAMLDHLDAAASWMFAIVADQRRVGSD